MVSRLKVGVLVSLIALTSGCATMNREECQTADWYLIGMQDAENGERPSHVHDYVKQCGEFGVKPDQQQFNLGHSKGLHTYCTQDIGFKQGKKGREYKGICPSTTEADFRVGYDIGQQYYAVNKEISALESKINSNTRKIKKNIQAIKNMKEMVLKSSDPAKKKQALMGEVLEKNNESIRLQAEIDFSREQLAVKKYQYQELVNKYGYQ